MTRMGQKPKTTKQRNAPVLNEFVHEFGWAIMRSANKPYSQSVRNLKRIEKNYLQRLEDNPDFALEVRRRVAEQLLDLALVHDRSLPVCQKLLRRNSELGWSLFDRKVHFHLIYARAMVARGHIRTANRICFRLLTELQERLERLKNLPRQTGRKWLLDSMALACEVLDEVRCAEGGRESQTWNSGGRYKAL